MIDPSIRLRRAILLRNVSLVERIVSNNPYLTQNPDFGDKSNTSLHLAAKEGSVEIAVGLLVLKLLVPFPKSAFFYVYPFLTRCTPRGRRRCLHLLKDQMDVIHSDIFLIVPNGFHRTT